MPTYEYKCPDCDYEFEKFQSITAAPIKRCPVCAKNKVQRLIGTGAGLIFKGSGFYITDYRSEGYKEKAKAESGTTTGDAKDAKPPGDGPKEQPKPAKTEPVAASKDEPKTASKSASKPAAKKRSA